MGTKARVYPGPYENVIDLDVLEREHPEIARRFEKNAGISKPKSRQLKHHLRRA